MRFAITIGAYLFLTYSAYGQNDSLKGLYSKNAIIRYIEKRSGELDKRQVTFIGFAYFSRFSQAGILLWKEKNGVTGIKLNFENERLNEYRIASKFLRRIRKSILFSNICDSIDIECLLNEDKRNDISQDLAMYLNRSKSGGREEVYFTYATYLGSDNFCIKEIKELMRLADQYKKR